LENWRDQVDAELEDPVEDHIWELLEKDGAIEDLDLGLGTVTELAASVRGVRAAIHPADRSASAVVQDRGLPQASEAARARIDALSAIYATWASARHDVLQYRSAVLARTRPIMAAATGSIAPPVEEAGQLDHGQVGDWVTWCYDADAPDGDGMRHVRDLIAEATPRGPRRVTDLWYINGRQQRTLIVPAAGVLGKLAKLAAELAEEYRWRPSEATMFILCGRTPEVFVYTGSAEIRYNERSATTRVTMTLDPALNTEEVAGIYGRLRLRLQPARPPKYQSARRYQLAGHIGPHVQIRNGAPGSRIGPGRPPRPGPAGLATFIEPISGYSWNGLRQTWNQAFGELTDDDTGRAWRYDNSSNFIRDSKTALEQLIFLGWTARR
jgi:hypothetical protein